MKRVRMLSNNFTVLYVEDNIEAQESMCSILEDDFKEFYQAYNGEEGLQIYKDKKPDIILSDIEMPLLDGLSMAEQIKKINKYQIIIIMSAFDDRNILLNAINIGIDYFIPKPVNIDFLNDKLNIISQNLQNKLDFENARKKEVDTLYNLAHFDVLTQVPNRFLFELKLEEAISRAKRNKTIFALFFIDLDYFKNINDTYGHIAGDEVLKAVAKNIKNIIRTEDTFARIGGDEFALIAEGFKDESYIESLRNKLLEIAPCLKFENMKVCISYSIGVSIFPKDSNRKKELLHLADINMYEEKKLRARDS